MGQKPRAAAGSPRRSAQRAARWGHRTSFDIDITVGRNTDLKEVRDGATQHVQALAEELQGAIVEEERSPTARLRVRFEKN